MSHHATYIYIYISIYIYICIYIYIYIYRRCPIMPHFEHPPLVSDPLTLVIFASNIRPADYEYIYIYIYVYIYQMVLAVKVRGRGVEVRARELRFIPPSSHPPLVSDPLTLVVFASNIRPAD
jgi:hypothetical protein